MDYGLVHIRASELIDSIAQDHNPIDFDWHRCIFEFPLGPDGRGIFLRSKAMEGFEGIDGDEYFASVQLPEGGIIEFHRDHAVYRLTEDSVPREVSEPELVRLVALLEVLKGVADRGEVAFVPPIPIPKLVGAEDLEVLNAPILESRN